MKKLNNLQFLKDIIDSDFSLLKASNKRVTTFDHEKKNSFSALNIFDLNKEIKQFFRVWQTLKQDAILYIWVEDSFLVELLNDLVGYLELQKKICVTSFMPRNLKKTTGQKALLILGTLNIKIKSSLFNKLFYNDFLFVNVINTDFNKSAFYSYKVYNQVNDIKKIIFIILLIKKIFSSNKN